MMVVVGSEVVAAAIYCQFWFPGPPSWVWIGLFSVVILYVNCTSIGSLGTFEYWLSMIKVVTIVAFLILGTALLSGVGFPRVGLGNYTANGGFLPNGGQGVGLGVVLGLFSFFGIEVGGTTAVDAADPKAAVPRLSGKNMAVGAVLASAGGRAAALGLSEYFKDSLFVFMIGLSTFGALFAWLITLLTHVAFRRFHKRQGRPYLQLGPPGPWASLLGLGGVMAVLVSTWWVPGFGITLRAGAPWLAFITVCYFVWRRARSRMPVQRGAHDG